MISLNTMTKDNLMTWIANKKRTFDDADVDLRRKALGATISKDTMDGTSTRIMQFNPDTMVLQEFNRVGIRVKYSDHSKYFVGQ